jgi:hypothetical protein
MITSARAAIAVVQGPQSAPNLRALAHAVGMRALSAIQPHITFFFVELPETLRAVGGQAQPRQEIVGVTRYP